MPNKPKYLARPSDGEVWSLNEDNKTYSSESQKKKFPEHMHNKYSLSRLKQDGFYEVEESDFIGLAVIGKQYREYQSWASRSDGHGGSKGGSIDEFRKFKGIDIGLLSDDIQELYENSSLAQVKFIHPGQMQDEAEEEFKLRKALEEIQKIADSGCFYGRTIEDYKKSLGNIETILNKNK